jgi:hypothetical protein
MAGIKVKIGADSSQFEKTMAKVKGQVGTLKSEFKAVGIAVAAAGAAVIAAGAAIAATTYKIIKWGEAANTASARTANAVQQMGVFGARSAEVSERLDEVAKSTSLATGIDRKSIQMTQAKLATFRDLLETADEAGGTFDRVTMAAINLAAAGFGTAEENAVQLGKAFSDVETGLTALKRSGTLTRQQIEDISQSFMQSGDKAAAFEKILQALEVQSKNAGTATADGTVKIANAFQIMREEFGRGLAGEFGKSVDALTPNMEKAIEKARKFGDEMGRIIGAAVRSAVEGDMQMFATIGTMIGQLISGGISIGMKQAGMGIGQGVFKGIESAANFVFPGSIDERIKQGGRTMSMDISEARQIMLEDSINELTSVMGDQIRTLQEQATAFTPQTTNAFRTQQFQSFPDSDRLTFRNADRAISLLENIDRKLSPTPFPAR